MTFPWEFVFLSESREFFAVGRSNVFIVLIPSRPSREDSLIRCHNLTAHERIGLENRFLIDPLPLLMSSSCMMNTPTLSISVQVLSLRNVHFCNREFKRFHSSNFKFCISLRFLDQPSQFDVARENIV